MNEKLRDRAMELSRKNEKLLKLGDDDNVSLRKLYSSPANKIPTILACDVLTSDNYFYRTCFERLF